MADTAHHASAPWLQLPQDRVVAVEHPCIVTNVDKALKSLGGEHHVKNLLAPAGQTSSVGLSLRPDDPLAKKLVSREVSVQNVLLRVTVPRRTGRKRKRGSDEPFQFHDPTPVSNPPPLESSHLLQHVRDNVSNYTVQPVGYIKETHRFRGLPDFQIKNGNQRVMTEIGKNLVNASLASIKNFQIDTNPGVAPNEHIIPPPTFTSISQTMNYGYKQNQGVTTITDSQGRVKAINLQKPKKRSVLAVDADIKQVPQGPPPDLTPLEQTNVYLEQAVKNIAALLEQRPIVTRRVAMNLIDWGSETLFKEATQYVGYSFKSGPWRDALIKWGIDPRQDSKYRIYQTLSFQLMSKDRLMAAAKKMADGRNTWIRSERYRKDEQPSHVFDGRGITTNGKTWQMCDIKEPLIKGLLDTDDLRSTCDNESCGWYQNGTMSKVRIIMRDMIGMMLLGKDPDLKAYETLSSIPNVIDPNTYLGCYFKSEEHGEKVVKLSSEIRNIAKTNMIMRAKVRAAVAADVDAGSQIGTPDGSAIGVGMDGANDEADEEVEFEVEGDDLNASDAEDAQDGADDDA